MLKLGQPAQLSGDVTRLGAIAAKAPGDIERALGYEKGRLAQGYWVALLRGKLRAGDIKFAGLTLRSGGREGLPLKDPADDARRMHIHQRLISEYGASSVAGMQAKLAQDERNLSGPERIAKVVPFSSHAGLNPAKEYPPGEGPPQWTLTASYPFFVALEVDDKGTAVTAGGWSVSIAVGARYDDRAKLFRYLERA